MGQGNPNKVNSIVDEIVKNNNVFKLKSPIEQDKEKDSMARSINSALSVLNEVGKELVLQDLSVDPDEKFKGFIDSVGNIDISGLTKMTATIVKAKIEEAEREGLNLRTGEPVFKNDNKISVVEGVLTVAVINTMITNFENLSQENRLLLLDKWGNLSRGQQAEIADKYASMIENGISNLGNEKDKEFARKVAKTTKGIANDLRKPHIDRDKVSNNDLQLERTKAEKYWEYISTQSTNIYNAFLKYLKQERRIINPNDIDILELIDIFENFRTQDYFKNVVEPTKQEEKEIEKGEQKHFSRELVDKQEQHKSLIEAKTLIYNIGTPEEIQDIKFDKITTKQQTEENAQNINVATLNNTNRKDINLLNPQISQEIEQLPIALATEGFSQEEISEAMKTYSEFIGGLNGKEDLHIFFDSESPTNEQICLGLKNVFENFKESLEPNSYKILQQLAQNDFGGHLQQILTNPQLLQETFLPALSAEIEKLEQQPIQDEHTDEYYRSQSETLQVDEEFEKIVKEIQAQGGGVKEITVALAKKVEERATEQSQHSIPEEESKEQKTEQATPPIFENPTTPEEPTQESATSPEQETLEETGQNMAMVKQDNSFIGKIRRVFANMRDMKNKDNSKGFFARLGASIKTVFGNKEEHYEEQDITSTAPTTENQSQSTARREPIDYLNQHFEVNESIARKETEKSKKEKDFSNADDRTTDEEEK